MTCVLKWCENVQCVINDLCFEVVWKNVQCVINDLCFEVMGKMNPKAGVNTFQKMTTACVYCVHTCLPHSVCWGRGCVCVCVCVSVCNVVCMCNVVCVCVRNVVCVCAV